MFWTHLCSNELAFTLIYKFLIPSIQLQELEAKMAQLRKQSTELNRLKKMKDENDKTVKKMTEDIIGLKTMRVKHIRQMKADSEEFRKWKQASQKEVRHNFAGQ